MLNRRSRASLRAFPTDRRAAVAVEFAVAAPVIITMILGVADLSRALIVWQEALCGRPPQSTVTANLFSLAA